MLKGKIKDFFQISGGNSGLTEEFVYNNQPKSKEDAVKVYSGSTIESNRLKDISIGSIIVINGIEKPIKWFSGEGIKIVRKGKAGALTYINENQYTINDDAYVLQVKKEYINDINLKYIRYSINDLIKECVSSSGEGKNGTFNKTLFNEKIINIPELDLQNKIAAEYIDILDIKIIAEKKLLKLNSLLRNKLISNEGEEVELGEIFTVNQGHQITDEELYNTVGNIPVYTADNTIKGYWDKSIVTESDLPCLSYATKAFAGKVSIQYNLFDANNTAILTVQEKWKDKVDLKYLKYILAPMFIEVATSKNGVSYLNKAIIEKIILIIPNIIKQESMSDEYEKLEKITEGLENIYDKCQRILR